MLSTRTKYTIAGLGMTVVLFMQGCRPSSPIRVIAGVDASASNSKQLGGSVYLLSRLVRLLSPGYDFLSIYRVDDKVAPVYIGTSKGSADFDSIVVPAVKPLSKETGTHPGEFWQQAAKQASENPQNVVVLYLTDGYTEQATTDEIQSIRDAVHQLAMNPRVVSVTVLGTNGETKLYWKDYLMELGERAFIGEAISPKNISIMNDLEAQARQKGTK